MHDGRHAAHRWTWMVLQWAMLPLTGIADNAAAGARVGRARRLVEPG